MRSRSFHRLMSRLALFSVLLLVLLPAAGRLMGAASEPGGSSAQLCPMTGLPMIDMPGDPGAPAAPGGMAMNCAYCSLVPLTLLVLAFVLVFAQASAQRLPAASAPPRRGRRHPSGLGSRGPPLAL